MYDPGKLAKRNDCGKKRASEVSNEDHRRKGVKRCQEPNRNGLRGRPKKWEFGS